MADKTKKEAIAEFLKTKPMNHVLFGNFTVEDIYDLVKYDQTYGPYVDKNTGDELLLQMLASKKKKKKSSSDMMNKMMKQMMGGGM